MLHEELITVLSHDPDIQIGKKGNKLHNGRISVVTYSVVFLHSALLHLHLLLIIIKCWIFRVHFSSDTDWTPQGLFNIDTAGKILWNRRTQLTLLLLLLIIMILSTRKDIICLECLNPQPQWCYLDIKWLENLFRIVSKNQM